jgi:hypothetical protein
LRTPPSLWRWFLWAVELLRAAIHGAVRLHLAIWDARYNYREMDVGRRKRRTQRVPRMVQAVKG